MLFIWKTYKEKWGYEQSLLAFFSYPVPTRVGVEVFYGKCNIHNVIFFKQGISKHFKSFCKKQEKNLVFIFSAFLLSLCKLGKIQIKQFRCGKIYLIQMLKLLNSTDLIQISKSAMIIGIAHHAVQMSDLLFYFDQEDVLEQR